MARQEIFWVVNSIRGVDGYQIAARLDLALIIFGVIVGNAPAARDMQNWGRCAQSVLEGLGLLSVPACDDSQSGSNPDEPLMCAPREAI